REAARLGRVEEEALGVEARIERPATDRAPGAIRRAGRDLDLELADERLGRLGRLLGEDDLLDAGRLGGLEDDLLGQAGVGRAPAGEAGPDVLVDQPPLGEALLGAGR